MKPREIKRGVYWVGAIDWDRRLFDSLIPLPDGTSYNAYLIKGSQKTALIDTVDPPTQDILLRHLDELKVKRIDYVIANHAEQDHSGSIPHVLEKYPEAKLICTPKCQGMLVDLLMVPEEKFKTVNDKETVSLGDRTLEFIHAPWVHWPETMLTYLKEDKILFPCDFFGSHLATTDLYVTDEGRVYEAAKRYYAEIMMPFRTIIEKNLEKLKGYKIDIVAPSHGPMYDKPEFIIQAYHSWVFDKPRNLVVLPYISMHGSTRQMVDYFVEALAEKGVTVQQFDLSVSDIGKLAMALVDAATVVIGAPTVLAGAHPNTAYAAFLANALRPKLKFVSIIGSYGWGGKTVEQLAGLIPNLKVEVLEPVLCKGLPRQADFKALEKLADTIAEKHKAVGFVSPSFIRKTKEVQMEEVKEQVVSLPRLGQPAPSFEAVTTQGPLKLEDYKGSWLVLFSHPADFTPVCTTEFIAFAEIFPDLQKRGVELLGLSVDSVSSHIAWARNVEEKTKVKIPFPIIADLNKEVSTAYGMIHPGQSKTETVRCVFIIDDKQVIRTILYYPLTTGRNMDEILRIIDALQTTDANGVATPANWRPGDKVVIPPPNTQEMAEERLKEGYECIDWYLCQKKL